MIRLISDTTTRLVYGGGGFSVCRTHDLLLTDAHSRKPFPLTDMFKG